MRNSLDTTRKAFEETELRTPFAGIAADIETEQFENVISNTSMSVLLTAICSKYDDSHCVRDKVR